jgi:hypothetical protein
MKPSLRFCLVLLLSVMSLMLLCLGAFGRDRSRERPQVRDDFRETGTATDIDRRREDFLLKTHNKSYLIVADRARVQLNGGRVGTLRDLKRNAQVTVIGDRSNNRFIRAQIIIVLEDSGKFKRDEPKGRPGDRYDRYPPDGRCSSVEGTITKGAGFFNRTITVRTRFGDTIVNVEKNAVVTRNHRGISMHDLDVGEKVIMSGRWQHHLLVADRVEVIGRYNPQDDRGHGDERGRGDDRDR